MGLVSQLSKWQLNFKLFLSIVIGGKKDLTYGWGSSNDNAGRSDALLELKSSSMKWKILKQKLNCARMWTLAIPIPEDLDIAKLQTP